MSKIFQLARTFLYVRKFLNVIIVVLALSCLLLTPKALAHSPLTPEDNESLATATLVPDPTKSWAIYGELHEGGEAQYYSFNIVAGEKIHVMLFKSMRSEEMEFLPGFVLMGPRISEQGTVPDYVEKPTDAKVFVVEGKQPAEATYEPFSPSSFYSLGEVDISAPSSGTYYVAVYEPATGGHYGLAVGDRESYTLDEWILIPLNLLSIYQWEGQSLALVFAPMIITLVIGIVLIVWRLKKQERLGKVVAWLGGLAGLLFIGSGATILFQMVSSLMGTTLASEVAITLVFALIPILLGTVSLRLSLKDIEGVSVRKRIYFVILGVVALFMWAGLFVGPALAIIASVMPSRLNRGRY